MSLWVEWRCQSCGKATVQRSDFEVLCAPSTKHRKWTPMARSPGAAIAEAHRAALLDAEWDKALVRDGRPA